MAGGNANVADTSSVAWTNQNGEWVPELQLCPNGAQVAFSNVSSFYVSPDGMFVEPHASNPRYEEEGVTQPGSRFRTAFVVDVSWQNDDCYDKNIFVMLNAYVEDVDTRIGGSHSLYGGVTRASRELASVQLPFSDGAPAFLPSNISVADVVAIAAGEAISYQMLHVLDVVGGPVGQQYGEHVQSITGWMA